MTLSVGILGACLGLYGIWKAKQVSENFGAGLGEACGASNVMCGGSSKEVFWIGVNNGYSYSSRADADQACKNLGADGLATDAQLAEAQRAGAQWCGCGWLKDTDNKKYPMNQNGVAGCGGMGVADCGNMVAWTGGAAGANCYGVKPSRNDPSKQPTIRAFTDKTNATSWSQSGLTYCLVNERTLPKGTVDQSVVFNMFGRYVRVMPSLSIGDGTFQISQVAVYDANGTNIAAGKTVTTTPTYGWSPAASVGVDGVLVPRKWDTSRVWHSMGNRTDYWQVDLGSVQMITSVRVLSRADCCMGGSPPDRITGTRIQILKTTDEVATSGTCTLEPTPIFPAGATTAEQVKLKTIILGGMDGQKALNVLRGIQSSTATPLTNYGLTDSQAAGAYNKLFMENLNFRRAGWQFSASWTAGTSILTVTGGVPPLVNMTVKTAKGIPVGARVTAVSGNTVTLDRNTDGITAPGEYSLAGGTTDQTVQTNGYKGRYVRIKASLLTPDQYDLGISQVVVYDANGTNLALGKPTTAVGTPSWSPGPQVAVDGNLVPRGWGGANGGVWHSGGNSVTDRETSYWQVDLGAVYAIKSVRILSRADCCTAGSGADRITGVRIQINDVPNQPNAPNSVRGQPVTMNGDMNDTSYFSYTNSLRSMNTVASITYDKAGTLADYMKWNKGNISVAVLDSAGNPVLNSAGNPTMSTIADNGETAATSMIMSATKVEAIDPVASDSGATKATTTSPEGVAGYSVPAAPNTSNWSENSLNKIPQQTAAINLGSQAPIVINPDTTDAQIAAQATGSFRVSPPAISQAVMDGAASSTTSSAGYSAPSQSESGVAGVSGGAVKEVFWIGRQNGYSFGSRADANQACVDAGADRLATLAELTAAQQAGAQWCGYGWLNDTDNKAFPMQECRDGCGCAGVANNGSGTAWPGSAGGANCFGFKPSANDGYTLMLPNNNVSQTVTINKSGRYVRLRPSRTGNGWMHFSQIVVKNKSGANISQGKPTYATSFLGCCGGSPPASVVVDGYIGPRSWGGAGGGLWHSGRVTVVNSTDPNNPNYDEEYFEIDLGSVQEISTIDYYGRPECCFETISGTRIEIAKSPRPRPFSNKTKSEAWNQKSKIDTSACPAGKTKISCNGAETCLDPGTACARSCPSGTSWNAEKQMCKN